MKIEHIVLGGERVSAADGKIFAVIEPASGSPFVQVAEAGPEDVDRAVQAAHRAFEKGSWHSLSATERGRILLQAEILDLHRSEIITAIETRIAGKPSLDAPAAISPFLTV